MVVEDNYICMILVSNGDLFRQPNFETINLPLCLSLEVYSLLVQICNLNCNFGFLDDELILATD